MKKYLYHISRPTLSYIICCVLFITISSALQSQNVSHYYLDVIKNNIRIPKGFIVKFSGKKISVLVQKGTTFIGYPSHKNMFATYINADLKNSIVSDSALQNNPISTLSKLKIYANPKCNQFKGPTYRNQPCEKYTKT